MKISACTIAKNEAKNIHNWLSCMSEIADELVVVDTGSVDDTKEIAVQFGAKVYDYIWNNDFAAAKNYAISKASGDWILFLDTDEYFSDTVRKTFRKNLHSYHKKAVIGAILCRLINIDTDNHNRIISTTLLPRIFRNTKDICYEGSIHEQLINHPDNLQMAVNTDFEIYHTGYSASIMQKKARRNLMLLLEREKKAKTQKEKDMLASYLMDAYNALGEYEKAIEAGKQCIEADIRMIGMEGHFYEIVFSAMVCAGYSKEEQVEWLDKAITKLPKEGCFVMEKGYVLWQMHDYIQAWEYLQRGLKMRREFEQNMQKGQLTTDNTLRLLPLVYYSLGDIAYKKGDKQQAAEFFLYGLQTYKYTAESLLGLCKCLAGTEAVDVIQILNTIYDKDKDKDGKFLADLLAEPFDGRLRMYYAPQGNNSVSTDNAKTYLLLQRYDAAGAEAAERLQYSSNALLASLNGLEKSSSEADNTQAMRIRNILEVLLGSRYKPVLQGQSDNTLEGKAVKRMLKLDKK